MSKPLWSFCALLSLGACVGDIATGAGGAPGGQGSDPPGGGGTMTPPGGQVPPGPGRPGTTPPGMTPPGMTPPGMGPPTTPPPPPQSRPPAAAVPTTRFSRLSHLQWENTVRDLLRLPATANLSVKFSPDSAGAFSNSGDTLAVSDTLRTDYQTAAEALAQRVARDAAALARLVPAGAPADIKGRGQAFIRDLGRRAHRRPLEEQEVSEYLALFDQGPALVPGADAFAAGAQLVIEALLQSAHFLYRTEMTTGPGRVRLGDYEIAAKLSYAISSTMPDDALFAAAAGGGLKSHEQVTAQAERLLARGGEPSLTFHNDLFHHTGLMTEIEKDPARFPEFKPAWRDSIIKESSLFLGEIFTGGRGLADLLTAPFTFVDATLAPLYGVKAPAAAAGFVRVDLDPQQRAGYLTQVAFLSRYGETESDPILRGAFVNHKLLCLDLEPPPGATENIVDPPASARTNRERVTAITSPSACATCHKGFVNPAGFAFEHYDPLGRYRTTESGQPVNAADTYAFPSGPKSFKNALEFSRLLAESPEVHDCYARGWFGYLNGRAVKPADEPFVKWLAGRSLGERASLRSLALTVVTDDSFLTRTP